MRLGFEESQTPYDSGSQLARIWTEGWKIRQQLQVLRNNGFLEFLGGGRYRLRGFA